jgi:hypothetical protein
MAQKVMGLGSENPATAAAIFNETTGFQPATVAAQAQQRMNQYLNDLLAHARNSNSMIDLAPARSEAESLFHQAGGENNAATIGEIEKLQKHLSEWRISGDAIPQHITPEEAVRLNEGLDRFLRNWQGGESRAVKAAMSGELSHAIPDYRATKNQIDALREIAESAGGKKAPQPIQRLVLDTFPELADIPTPTLEGAKKTASKLVSFPEAQLAIARTLNSGVIPATAKAPVATYEASRGPQRWVELGARKLAVSGIDDATITRLRTTREGRQLLMDAGDAAVGSRRLAAIVNDLQGRQ